MPGIPNTINNTTHTVSPTIISKVRPSTPPVTPINKKVRNGLKACPRCQDTSNVKLGSDFTNSPMYYCSKDQIYYF